MPGGLIPAHLNGFSEKGGFKQKGFGKSYDVNEQQKAAINY